MLRVIKSRKNGVCPKCGRKGEYKEFNDGSVEVIHAWKKLVIPGLGEGREITDLCRTKKATSPEVA